MNKEEFIKFIRRYPTDKVIKYFSNLSMKMYKIQKPYVWETIPFFYKKNSLKGGNVNFVYSQHEMIAICYFSILYGNDYRYKNKRINKQEGIELLDALKKYRNECSGKDGDVAQKYNEFFVVLFNEQIQFQKIQLSIELFNRLCFMMEYINKKYNKHPEYIDFDFEIKQLTNMSIEKYNKINVFITSIIVGLMNPNLSELISNIKLDFSKLNFSKDDLINFIKRDTHDYKYYRGIDKNTENWNNLKYSPLVITDKNSDIFVVNIYAYIISFASKLYWLVRNKYKLLNSTRFTAYFGFCFEMYLKELLDYYKIDNYIKINEKNTKQPDWLIETEDYNIIIEQKSTLFTIGSRDTILNNKYKELDKFINVVKKAFEQLSNYVPKNSKITIRICLTFEEIYFEEGVQEVAINMLDVNDKETYWIVNIGDFEKIIYLLKNNYYKFKEIINKKIELEKVHAKEGKSLELFLPKENFYIKNRINYFYNISFNLLNKIRND